MVTTTHRRTRPGAAAFRPGVRVHFAPTCPAGRWHVVTVSASGHESARCHVMRDSAIREADRTLASLSAAV